MEDSSKIFISYRREDTAGYAGRLNDALVQHFGADRVFMDVVSIEYGVDFVEVLENAVGSCKILIALIGKHWLEALDKKGQRRLDNPQDLVRVEIATALKRGIKVIPAIVQDAPMPTEDVLPEPLARLARRNAIELSDNRWKSDVKLLIASLEKELGTETTEPPEPEKVKEPLADADADNPQPKPEDLRKKRRKQLQLALIAALAVAVMGSVAWLGITRYSSGSQSNHNAPLNSNSGNSNNGNTAQPDPAGEMKYYEGHISNEPISLMLKRQGELLSGTISNHKTRRLNIPIKGTINDAQNIFLQELDSTSGKETGIYRGKLTGNIIEGTWSSPDGGQKIPFYLQEVH